MPFEIRIWSIKIVDGREKESSGKVVLKNQMIENEGLLWLFLMIDGSLMATANVNVVGTNYDSYAGIRSSDEIF